MLSNRLELTKVAWSMCAVAGVLVAQTWRTGTEKFAAFGRPRHQTPSIRVPSLSARWLREQGIAAAKHRVDA